MRKTALVSLIILLSAPLYAGTINMENGNYAISFSDIAAPYSGGVFKIHRVYNSGSDYRGIFGFSFGSNLEHRLVVNAEGSVEFNNHGSGAQEVFASPDFSKKIIDEIISNIIKKSPAIARSEENQKRLSNDYAYRQRIAGKLGLKSEINPGTKFTSRDLGEASLIKLKNGWELVSSDGEKQWFNDNGKIVKQLIDKKYPVYFSYDKKDRLAQVSDGKEPMFTISYNTMDLVSSIKHSKEPWEAVYEYNFNFLKKSKDAGDHNYTYIYDKGENLATIRSSDGKTEIVEYDRTNRDRVKFHKSFDGIETTYSFVPLDKENPLLHFKLTLSKKFSSERDPASSAPFRIATHTFKSSLDARGINRLDWTELTEAGTTIQTHYNEQGLPSEISRNGKKTSFEYYQNGLLKKKTLPNGSTVALAYNEKHRKVSEVERDGVSVSYKYDKNGNLITAHDKSTNKSVELSYDDQNRIKNMTVNNPAEKGKETLAFTYNNLGKPKTIELVGVAKITPVYDSQGNIIDMKSTNGRQAKIQAQQVFSSLMQMVQLAKVTLEGE